MEFVFLLTELAFLLTEYEFHEVKYVVCGAEYNLPDAE